MNNTISTIQEITLRAKALNIFDELFNKRNMSRPEIFRLFEKWGTEFESEVIRHEGESDWIYYDKIDAFLEQKLLSIGNKELEDALDWMHEVQRKTMFIKGVSISVKKQYTPGNDHSGTLDAYTVEITAQFDDDRPMVSAEYYPWYGMEYFEVARNAFISALSDAGIDLKSE
ncbi:MAG: hypothetical protein J6W09_11325 [Bacteroidales bacterium]|nr:hypothetical protein [Bacteroidales bacterium]